MIKGFESDVSCCAFLIHFTSQSGAVSNSIEALAQRPSHEQPVPCRCEPKNTYAASSSACRNRAHDDMNGATKTRAMRSL